jgi:signal peptidase II
MEKYLNKLRYVFGEIVHFSIANKLTVVIVFVVLALDQVSKAIMRSVLTLYVPVEVIGDFFRFTLVYNRGISFGIFNSSGVTFIHYLLPFLVVLIIILLFYIYLSLARDVHEKVVPWVKVSFGMIWGGALGNLVDRIIFGYVTDFIDVGIGNVWRFFTFNIADASITVGTVILILATLYSDFLKSRVDRKYT